MRFELIRFSAHAPQTCVSTVPPIRQLMVPKAGLEPARPRGQQILSLLCLPIPSLGHLAES